MEHFLADSQRYCIECKARRCFGVSRFGCVFTCLCPGVHLDFQKVFRTYVADVSSGIRSVDFVPVVSGSISTDRMKIAQVELDLINNEVCLRFINTTLEDALQILGSLPHSLGQWTVTTEGQFRFDMDYLDLLVHELKLLSGANGERIYVTEPSRRCGEVLLASKRMTTYTLDELLPPRLFFALHQHQKDGIIRALLFGGRALFADEMGVGKTLQAIGTLAALKAFPALIVCPAALRHMWVEEVEKWLMDILQLDDIHVINSSSNFLAIKDSPKVVITSYHMAALLAYQMRAREWRCVIADESHTLHTAIHESNDAQYTSLVCDLGRRSQYCLFLSGTPSLASPFDIFNQVDTLSKGLLGGSRCEFALRYCRTEFSPYFKVHECIRNVELHSLLVSTCMIRRLKSETLIDLPFKQRLLLRVPEKLPPTCRKGVFFQEEYSTSWTRKAEEILLLVDFVSSKYSKIVLFAHHIKLLDCLTAHVSKKRLSWIRIDGSTPMSLRETLLLRFNKEDTQVAIIGITACAVGIKLTGASCALFAELPPDATWMQQAEDRLHRPGQEKHVLFYYIIGAGSSFDNKHFARLCQSFQAVRSTTDGFFSSLTASYTADVSSFGGETNKTLFPVKHSALPFSITASVQLLFRISRNTGRIHVSQGGKHFLSLSLDEAQQHWCLTDDFSQQLKSFLLNVELLSLVDRRQLRLASVWLPCNFSWRPKKIQRKTACRYARDCSMFGRVFFWTVSWRSYPPHSYGALLRASGGHYVPLCLECEEILSCDIFPSPGDVVSIENDTVMFCSGKCRELFFIKRSGSAARRSVREADKGICSRCQVDCELLCSLLAARSTRKEREDILDQLHPQMRHYPVLFNRIVEAPTQGNIWNADHVVPVSQGGGQANLDNLQTLCVACHADKTLSDFKIGVKYTVEEARRTTVDISSNHFAFKSVRRVTKARMLF